DEVIDDAETVSTLLAFDARVEPDRLAEESGLPVARVRAALTQLGTAGRVGYDHADAAYFHRELPYDAERAAKQNPRLRAARDLLDAGAVAWDGAIATITVEDHVQRVRAAADGALSCTCQWYAKYQGGRGPCKHILAADAYRRGERGSASVWDEETADEGQGREAVGKR
ncbi:MAG: SWIM zinc finger family protein, partial [Catenulispora sp.]|nr:SWIM zinc finger family protein [Catenulispora sp.]